MNHAITELVAESPWVTLHDATTFRVDLKNETAEALREKLETLSLHPGVTASDYVNNI